VLEKRKKIERDISIEQKSENTGFGMQEDTKNLCSFLLFKILSTRSNKSFLTTPSYSYIRKELFHSRILGWKVRCMYCRWIQESVTDRVLDAELGPLGSGMV
jgi:hypothetical protein